MMIAKVRPAKNPKVSVLMSDEEAERFANYCRDRGFKKSTLIARLIREHLDREGYELQKSLFGNNGQMGKIRGNLET
jgi:hypothetical protein|tara:strand:+ start:653 stop:883 length:231 start_codon:yes stop_codon:yes gene_type:complete